MKKKILLFATLLGLAGYGHAQLKELDSQEKELLQTYESELKQSTQMAFEDKFVGYMLRYGLDWEGKEANQLNQILYQQELRKQMCDYYIPQDPLKRFQKKRSIEGEYEEAIYKILALHDNMGLPNLFLAIYNKEPLKLSESQFEAIQSKMLQMRRQVKNNPGKYYWGDELITLEETLNGEQLDHYFRIKNAGKATRFSKVIWQRLKEAGMTNDLDSTSSFARIYVHQVKILQATDMYWNDETKKREAWAAIDKYAPVEIRRTYSISRKNIAKKQGYKGSFNW